MVRTLEKIVIFTLFGAKDYLYEVREYKSLFIYINE